MEGFIDFNNQPDCPFLYLFKSSKVNFVSIDPHQRTVVQIGSNVKALNTFFLARTLRTLDCLQRAFS